MNFCHIDGLIFGARDVIIIITKKIRTYFYKENTFMRIAKRALIGILAFAVLVSGLFVASFAEEPYDYADILKYYDPASSQVYVHESFVGDDFAGAVHNTAVNKNDSFIGVVDDDAVPGKVNSYLSMIAGPSSDTTALGSMSYHVDVLEGCSALYIQCMVRASHTERTMARCTRECGYYTEAADATVCPDCAQELDVTVSDAPAASLYVSDAFTETSGVLGAALVRFDFESGKVYYYDGSSYSHLAGIELDESVWYGVEVVYNGNEYKVTVSDISDASGLTFATAAGMSTPTLTVKSVALGYGVADDNRDTTVDFDNVLLQAGLDYRAVSSSERDSATRAALDKFNNDINSDLISDEVKTEIARVFDVLVGTYGYTTDDADALDDIAGIKSGMLNLFSDALATYTSAIDTGAAYSARMAHVEAAKGYAERVEEMIAVVDGADASHSQRLGAYKAEVSALATVKSEAEAFMAFIDAKDDDNAGFYSSPDYDTLYDFINEVESSYPYDVTYPGITDSVDKHLMMLNRYNANVAAAEKFVICVSTAVGDPGDADYDSTLAERLHAYEDAVNNYFADTTYPDVSDAISDFESLTDYAAMKVVADRFIKNVETAEMTLYLPSKLECVRVAENDIESVEPLYPGVADAIKSYNAISADIAAKYAAAEAYIQAVKALEGLTGNALREAVAEARKLQKTGNILGYESKDGTSVNEANEMLDNIDTGIIQKADEYANKFITLVGKIDSSLPLAERFAAIKAAKAAEADASNTVAGVSAAKSALQSAIAAYNADVKSVNDSYASLAGNAGTFSGAAIAASDIVAYVIAFIKSIIG